MWKILKNFITLIKLAYKKTDKNLSVKAQISSIFHAEDSWHKLVKIN